MGSGNGMERALLIAPDALYRTSTLVHMGLRKLNKFECAIFFFFFVSVWF